METVVFDNNTMRDIKFVDTDYGVAFQYLKRSSCAKCRFKVYDKEYGRQADYDWRLLFGELGYALI